MPKAIWNDTVLAESDARQIVEGNYYFPRAAVKSAYLHPGTHRTVCAWKGTAGYYDVVVDGKVNSRAAWYYPPTKDAARHIQDYIAFRRGVRVDP